MTLAGISVVSEGCGARMVLTNAEKSAEIWTKRAATDDRR